MSLPKAHGSLNHAIPLLPSKSAAVVLVNVAALAADYTFCGSAAPHEVLEEQAAAGGETFHTNSRKNAMNLGCVSRYFTETLLAHFVDCTPITG